MLLLCSTLQCLFFLNSFLFPSFLNYLLFCPCDTIYTLHSIYDLFHLCALFFVHVQLSFQCNRCFISTIAEFVFVIELSGFQHSNLTFYIKHLSIAPVRDVISYFYLPHRLSAQSRRPLTVRILLWNKNHSRYWFERARVTIQLMLQCCTVRL